MLHFWLSAWIEALPEKPVFKTVQVIARRLALPENEYINQRERKRNGGNGCGFHETHAVGTEQQEHENNRPKCAADQIPKQVPVQTPGLALGIVGAIGIGETNVGIHCEAPMSTVALEFPKAANNAFTMTGAPAMMRPPTMDIFPASASPRRI